MAIQSSGADSGSDRSKSDLLRDESEAITVQLTSRHSVDKFCCARDPSAVDYIQKSVWKHISARCGSVFVLPDANDANRILGFYHLVGTSLARGETSNKEQRHTPSGSPISVFTIAYIARCDSSKPGTGGALIVDAARRAYAIYPTWGLTLYAKNSLLVDYYKKFGFTLIRTIHNQAASSNGNLQGPGPFHMYAPYDSLILGPS